MCIGQRAPRRCSVALEGEAAYSRRGGGDAQLEAARQRGGGAQLKWERRKSSLVDGVASAARPGTLTASHLGRGWTEGCRTAENGKEFCIGTEWVAGR
jgi:hypothetical protein